jgi:hypothetical protein
MKQDWLRSMMKTVMQRLRQVWQSTNRGSAREEFFDWRAEFKDIDGIQTYHPHGIRSDMKPSGWGENWH